MTSLLKVLKLSSIKKKKEKLVFLFWSKTGF